MKIKHQIAPKPAVIVVDESRLRTESDSSFHELALSCPQTLLFTSSRGEEYQVQHRAVVTKEGDDRSVCRQVEFVLRSFPEADGGYERAFACLEEDLQILFGTHTVVLKTCGINTPIHVAKVLRQHLSLPLVDARDMAFAPLPIRLSHKNVGGKPVPLTRAEAEQLHQALSEINTVEVELE